jgi:hypothetical protein
MKKAQSVFIRVDPRQKAIHYRSKSNRIPGFWGRVSARAFRRGYHIVASHHESLHAHDAVAVASRM